eukprot:8884308-Lingulodinium_polyedra.AAC.1
MRPRRILGAVAVLSTGSSAQRRSGGVICKGQMRVFLWELAPASEAVAAIKVASVPKKGQKKQRDILMSA